VSTSAQLRDALADRLIKDGTLTEPEWSSAARTVPRELFTGSYFVPEAGSVPTRYRPVRQGAPGWLEGVYSDKTLITQLDGRVRPDDVLEEGTVTGSPSSSSTLPSLVLRMWQRFGAKAGQRVLEIGTGTGYSTALGAHRLGDGDLTSIEYDPVVGRAAAAALKEATGRFLPGYTSFMIARPHDRPPRPTPALLPGEERPSRIDPAKLDNWTGGWVAQLAAPSAERMGAGAEQVLWDVSTGSQARTAPNPDGGWTVVQRGPVRLWDRVERAVRCWQAAGEPHQEGFGITVSAAGQRVWLGTEKGPGWDLPI